jgi:PIN domain nuclease of toxin-antitoxin system
LLAAILQEPGDDFVKRAIREGGFIGAVNLSEAITRLIELSFSDEQIRRSLQVFDLTTVDFDTQLAWDAARLRAATRSRGLSFGDRSCLAIAAALEASALTADRNWANLDVGVEVVLCR